MDSLPAEIIGFLQPLRPLMRLEVFHSFVLLLAGILIGEAKHGTVRASVLANSDYQPQRLSDLFCCHRLSHQRLMAALAQLALGQLYPQGLPARLYWIADSTHTEKPYAQRIASTGLFHRTKRVVGRARHLVGHCYVFAAHLYRDSAVVAAPWASVLVGALLYVKGRSIAELVGVLAQHLRLPATVRHVWRVDRGILSRPLLRSLAALGHFVVGRVRCNQVVYFAPLCQPAQGRRRAYGPKCRVDQLRQRWPQRLRQHSMRLHGRGRERTVQVYDAEGLLRGVWPGRPLPARVIVVCVPDLPRLTPWYLLTTDLTLDPLEAVSAYAGRAQIELNFDEVKELGLGHYQGRSAQGVRRWPLVLSLAQLSLKLIATGGLPVELPTLSWPWYPRENTVGQVRRRLIEYCRPRLSRPKGATAPSPKITKAA
jgi:hypothetical protein